MAAPKYAVSVAIPIDPIDPEKVRWRTIGAAWEHVKNGHTRIDVRLDAIPINFDGKLYLFERDTKEEPVGRRFRAPSEDE